MNQTVISILFGLLTLGSILLGGAVALKFNRYLKQLIAFCAGTLVTTALIEILPESLEILPESNRESAFFILLASFFFFLLLDKLFFIHSHAHADHDHDHDHTEIQHQEPNPLGLVSSLGIVFHTFLDGLLIGTSFLLGDKSALLITAVILFHDFTDGVSTVTVLLRHKQSRKVINFILISAGLTTMLGILVANLVTINESALGYLFATFAGLFLYLGATDLLPEVHKEKSSFSLLSLTLLGSLAVVVLHFLL